jgi:hypothetical protein
VVVVFVAEAVAGVWPAMRARDGTAAVVARARAATRRRVERLVKRDIGQVLLFRGSSPDAGFATDSPQI